ncbi:MAG: hypothetical protein DMD35_06205 [Gemmatimonadetes bacterium]|nr:MAG: hypothetical protein DMD35_06205 [Gemmatimonadota bacterium]
MRLAGGAIIRALLIVSGVFLLIPGRNTQGDPWHEREMASCTLSDSAEVTLYQGEGGGSEPTWYSVTHNPRGLERERQILYRSRSPGLYDLFCDSTGVVIQTGGEPITLTAKQARQLRESPAAGARSRLTVRPVFGAVLLIAGGALLWSLRPRRDDDV